MTSLRLGGFGVYARDRAKQKLQDVDIVNEIDEDRTTGRCEAAPLRRLSEV